MRSILIACAALGAVSIAVPVATASAQAIVIKTDHGRSMHREVRHRSDWRHHNAKVVVIKKHRRHD